MADLTITAASVLPSTGSMTEDGLAGESITAGQTVYLSSTTYKYLKADADSATPEARVPRGIALNTASAGQPLRIQKSGQITIGATLTAGTTYYQSLTAGGIAPLADITTGGYKTLIGIASSTSAIALGIVASGVVV